jgi:hypothetical protein
VALSVDQFIARWQGQTGGAERANYALFLTELCAVLEVEPPQPASAEHQHNNYVFERAVSFKEGGDRIGHGRIDLYKRGHFVLEAKQSRQAVDRPFEQLALEIPPSPPRAILSIKTRY